MISIEAVTTGDLGRQVPDFISSASTIFGTPLWIDTVLHNKSIGGAFRTKAILARESRNVCGFLVGCEFHLPGFKGFFSPLPRTLSQYGGLSVLPEFAPAKERITDSLMWAVYEKYDFGFIITPPGLRFSPKQARQTWAIIPRKSLGIDLTQGKEEIWSSVHLQARKGIKRALKNGIKVDFVYDQEILPHYFRMLTEVAKRTAWDLPFGEAFFKDAFSRFKDNSVIARALLDDEFVAGAILFYDSRALYCYSFAAGAKGRKLQAADLLQWSITNWGKERGFVTYDLLGGNIPRIAHFKRSLGATDIDYDAVAFSKHSPLAHLERWALGLML